MGTDTFWGLSATAWTGITTLLTAGLVGVAVVAAIYAQRQWKSASEQINANREAEFEARRPYVIVTVEPTETSRHLFDLVVRNIGQRPAHAVSISLDPPPVRARKVPNEPELSDAKMLTEPVSMIAPGQEMRAFYDSYIERNARDDLPATHKVSLTYQDSSGRKYTETSVIDIDAMKGTMFTTVKTVHDLAESLAKIQETLGAASVLARQGSLGIEASVERRAERQERVAKEQAEARQRHEELVRRLQPSRSQVNGTTAAEPSEPA